MKKITEDQSKDRILKTAIKEFVEKGFDGARVDSIAAKAKVNKQLIYYYFKSKDLLFIEVLKDAYARLRSKEKEINLEKLCAYDALIELVKINWDYYTKSPELIFLLASENLMKARHLVEHKQEFIEINKSWGNITKKIIERGKIDKSIKDGIDPMQFNISVAALVIFYISNRYTLSILYEKKLMSKEEQQIRLNSIIDIVGSWIKN